MLRYFLLRTQNMKKLILFGMCCLFLCSAALAINKGKAQMTLDGGRRGVVQFPHQLHQDKLPDCNVCHHLFPQKPGIIKQMKSNEKLKSKEVMNKQCIKCHKKNRRKNKPHGPISCSKCHEKK